MVAFERRIVDHGSGRPALAEMGPVMPPRGAYRPGRTIWHPAQRSLARCAAPAVAVAAVVLATHLPGPSRDSPSLVAVRLGAGDPPPAAPSAAGAALVP
jgi:hypothetical protein